MGISARSEGRLIAGDQRLAGDHSDIARGDGYVIPRGDEVLGPDMAISKKDTRKLGDDIVGVSDAEISAWLPADVVCCRLLADLRGAVGVLCLWSDANPTVRSAVKPYQSNGVAFISQIRGAERSNCST